MFTKSCLKIFEKAIDDYHLKDNVDAPLQNPFGSEGIESLLYQKNWIDAVQWHLEDIIRDPQIDPGEALEIKRRIDRSNQDRTDIVERIDDHFLEKYQNVKTDPGARINTESPGWSVDRLSILALKIYHMQEQVLRTDSDQATREECQFKLNTLLEQKMDLSRSIDDLLGNYASGRKVMKVYRQMKMYNDPRLNPVLYGSKK